jgi:hypothetical protein
LHIYSHFRPRFVATLCLGRVFVSSGTKRLISSLLLVSWGNSERRGEDVQFEHDDDDDDDTLFDKK